MGKRRMEITAFRYRRTLVLRQRPGPEREWVEHSNSCEEWSVPVEADSAPVMRLLTEALIESKPDSARADERMGTGRTSYFSKLLRVVFGQDD